MLRTSEKGRELKAVSDNGRYGLGFGGLISRAVREEDEEVDGAFCHWPSGRALCCGGSRLGQRLCLLAEALGWRASRGRTHTRCRVLGIDK